MSEQTLVSSVELGNVDELIIRFPGKVEAENRKSFEGYIVNSEKLVEVATALRNEMGYDYLSSVTGVDNLPENSMEVVYHAYRTIGGPGLVFRVKVSRDNA